MPTLGILKLFVEGFVEANKLQFVVHLGRGLVARGKLNVWNAF